ncbi:fibronectin type III domain-containing protein [Actinacidiphila sp. ITFR-21]|uniref:fibronectin type III domain-containing protein n=1 Tax=Actinacidiphila sp. ITFR-21 TaxID=3075199 RepID=UPI002889274E|nr:fibronectin type III domain-containing protein [Streptomyces sp. ITFR-21]WNI17573.1 fibronectin type III domain-containing protein [Streptomyces sp. ITFR-21]WNI17713.1 fibronectin type III domain-containing protein [Streptomyces sp. ITFR-21]
MANEKWHLETNTALTAEPGSAVGLVEEPLTAEERVAERPVDYGDSVVPPKPTWYKTADGQPTGAGRVQPHEVQLYWHSNIGEIAAHSKMPPLPPLPDQGGYSLGSRGLDHIYIAGHRVTIVGEGDVTVPGGDTDALITGYWDRTDPVHPQWVRIQPETSYTVTVAAYNHDDVYGAASDPLTITTPAVGYDQQHNTLPPGPVNDLQFAGPLPVITSSGGGPISLRWQKQLNVTKYEVYTNPSRETDVPMDPARIGLELGDVKLGEINQPSGSAQTVTYTTPNFTVPDQLLALKVRAVRTDANGTSTGPFSIVLRSQIPPATAVPGKAGTPTLTESPVVGGQVKLTLAAPSIGPTNGSPTYYAVYDGVRKVATVDAPLGTAPHITLSYKAGQAYSFTVVAGNSLGVGPASTALTGTVPTPAAPAAPTGLALSGSPSTTSVPVQWNAITMDPPVTKYTLYQGSTNKGDVNAPNASGTVTGYTAGQSYSITVTATNSVGESVKSTAITGKTNAVPGAPTSVGVTNVTATGMDVAWTPPTGAQPAVTAHRVYDGSTLKATVPAGTNSTTLTGYTPSTAYSITVAAVNSVGEGAKSSPSVTGTTPAS